MPIVMSVRRPAALMRGPIAKPRSRALARSRIFAGDLKQRGDARAQPALTNPLQPLPDQDAVVAIEPDDVSDGAERDQIEQMIEARLGCNVEGVARAQFGAQCEQHIEHHADARQMLARESAAGLVRIDDAGGSRQHGAGQVMVGDQHRDAELVRARPRLRRSRCRCRR